MDVSTAATRTETALTGADLDLLELALRVGRLPLGVSAGVLTDAERTPVAEVAEDGEVTALAPLAPPGPSCPPRASSP